MARQQVRCQFGPLGSAVKRYDFSRFGNKFTQHSGIAQLMDDMNEGLRSPGAIMLGGGNPASIPAMEQYFNALWREMLDDGSMSEARCNYDGP
ncbi:MAG: hypothetical protein ACMX3H_16300 [Sodalis sp. (in: enterobacteria)]|uniref:hypothetical protein n=1 Tax=Sodalis sp. (in: enterobacteria) TaxID=1898979 RepID=UPI0039E6F811